MWYKTEKIPAGDINFFLDMIPYISRHIEEIRRGEDGVEILCSEAHQEEVLASLTRLEITMPLSTSLFSYHLSICYSSLPISLILSLSFAASSYSSFSTAAASFLFSVSSSRFFIIRPPLFCGILPLCSLLP